MAAATAGLQRSSLPFRTPHDNDRISHPGVTRCSRRPARREAAARHPRGRTAADTCRRVTLASFGSPCGQANIRQS
ncbi:MAG TPA: hypothetical protein VFH94_12990 [Streptomyces sp.]|nr:hypothetical protein [Streptomyces sp.]